MEDEYYQERLKKLESMRAKGVDPYGHRFDGVSPVEQVAAGFEEGTEQKVRVTVFRIPIGSTKSEEPPGPLEVVIQPGELWHNANQATGGFYYEVQVECSSREVFPYACAWKGLTGDPIVGTVVKSAEFIEKVG